MSVTAEIGLGVLKKVFAAWMQNKGQGGDLIKYTASSRVEPIALIDSDVLHHDMLPDVMQSLQSIFAGYYLQALAISSNIGRIDVIKHLDKLNPNRNPVDAMGSSSWLMSMESYQHGGLPRLNTRPGMEAYDAPEYENAKDKDAKKRVSGPMTDRNQSKDGKSDNGNVGINKDNFASVRDLANLSVGKLLNVEITDGANKATIPISIRLMATYIPTSSIIHILSLGNKDTTMKERWHGWRSGRLEFVRDIIFCQDLIDAHKKNLIDDKSGVYNEILKRRRNNAISTLVSGDPSLATASNLLVCSMETIRTLEGEIGREFKDFKTREKIFAESYLMIIAVIDKEWDRVTFYHRGINLPTQVSLRDLRVANKGTGPDVSEILKAYQLGNGPQL